MGSSKKVTVGYKYFLGMHVVLCKGPIDRILKIRFDARDAWKGSSTGGAINVSAENLFGGKSREGGVSGVVDFEQGSPTQGRNAYLQSVLGAAIPAFRGVAALVFRKFYLGLNPYLKPLSVVAQRVFVRQDGIAQWYLEKAGIPFADTDAVFVESFTSGSLAAYTTVSGDASRCSIVSETYGSALRFAGVTSPVVTLIERELADAITPTRLKIRCKVAENRPDDSAAIFRLRNAAGAVTFTLVFSREGAYDSARRALSSIGGFMGEAGGTARLTVGQWYEFDLRKTGTNGYSITLTRLADAVVVHTVSGTASGFLGTVKKISFGDDAVIGSATTYVDGVELTSSDSMLSLNAAHIIRECITDPDWGLGYPEESVNEGSFTACADQLYAEGMGLSLLWDEQQPIEDFVQLVLNHIDATLYVDEQAQWTLKLIRDDYDEASLPVLDPSNVETLENPARVAFGDLVNSVTVNYTNGTNFKKASITVGDPALSQAQGKVINTTLQYPGFCTAALASRAASRDLKALSTPLFSCILQANREAAPLKQGGVFKLTWPKYKLDELVMRVTAIALGDGRSNKVRITAVEDVFAVPTAPVQVTGNGTGWEDPSAAPQQATAVLAFEVPYYELVQARGQTAVDADLLARPESGLVGAAAVRPPGSAVNASIWTDAGAGFDEEGVLDFCPSAVLQDPIGRTDTVVALLSDVDLDVVTPGTHAQIGAEIVAVDSIVGLSLTFRRGVLDTVPVIHAAGERIYFWDEYSGSAAAEYVDGETIAVKVLPINGAGEFELDAATAQSVVLSSRAERPYPPGNFTINGSYWPDLVVDFINVAWSHRDRLQQTAGTLMDFTDGDIGPEAGTTYTVRLLSVDHDVLLDEATGLTGTSHTLSGAFTGDVYLQLLSVRDGLSSWQIHQHRFTYLGTGARVVEPDGTYRLAESGDYRVQE